MISLDNKSNIENSIIKLNNKTRILSIIRFLLIMTIITFVICFISLENTVLYLCLSIISIVILIIYSKFTNKYYNELNNIKSLEYVYKRHLNRRNGSYKTFSPDGKEFIDYNDHKVLDLDLLGPKSLFQYLCVAKTYNGRKKLAKQITNPVTKDNKYSKLVYNFANNEESLKLEAAINNIDSKNSYNEDEMLSILDKEVKINKTGLLFMVLSYVLLIVLSILFGIFKVNYLYLLFFIPVNILISYKYFTNEIFNINSTKYSLVLNDYIYLIKELENINIVDDFYLEIKEELKNDLDNFIKLNRVFDMLSYRKNVILSLIGNGVCYLNLITLLLFKKQVKKIDSIKNSLDLINDLEVMLSLSIVGLDNEVFSLPIDSDTLNVKEVYHPLINNCVPNDFNYEKGVILTGSNMAGKTTFMRTLGINQVLKNAGGIVLAKEYHSPKLNVYTSLRTVDTLQEGISTFYAEINKMKCIIENANENSLVLIDEIFKGTNAKDRIYSASEIIKKLNDLNANFIITTHDFELCDTENIINYHFDEEYKDNQILFDYKIKQGKTNKTNAIYLLKMAGVIE